MKRKTAETVALQALGWLASDDEQLMAFLGMTGAGIGDLAAGASNPAFLASVLDFLLAEDGRIIAFCEQAGLDCAIPMQARAALPGGAQMHWT